MSSSSTPLLSEENLPQASRKSFGVSKATFFLVGNLAGSGVLALPFALVEAGWSGLVLIFLFALLSCYSGIRLGSCWEILSQDHDEFNSGLIKDPYPLIAEKVGLFYGSRSAKALRFITASCMTFILLGTGCVFLLLISDFLLHLTGSLNKCLWLIIAFVILTPVTWLGTPKEFWQLSVLAVAATVLACVFIVVQVRLSVVNGPIDCNGHVFNDSASFEPHLPLPTFDGYFSSMSTIIFAFGGLSTFPTIQADMERKSRFKWAALMAMLSLFAMYTVTASVGYFSLGDCVQNNILDTLGYGPYGKTSEVLILVHLLSALPMILNTPNQHFENQFDIPEGFAWQRCLIRTATTTLILLIAEAIPNFGAILNLVGAGPTVCVTFIFPPIFYLVIAGKSRRPVRVSLAEKIFCCAMASVGAVGGAISTYVAVKDIVASSEGFAESCFK